MEILLREETKQTIFSNLQGLTFSDGKTPGHILASDCKGLFDIASGDTVYAVYVSNEGEIIQLERLNKGWKKSTVLKSRSGKMEIFGLRLITAEDKLNLIYGLNHNAEKLIVHQPLPDSTPEVVTSSHSESFFVRRDDSGCIYTITEAADNIWHFCVLRNGVWSSPKELITDCFIVDIMTDGYKSFCILYRNNDGYFLKYQDVEVPINGERPYIAKQDNMFRAISERQGRIYLTDMHGERPMITSETVKDYVLRLPYSGEYAVAEHCRGNLIHGKPRLFLIDRAKPPSAHTGDAVRLELTKRIIELETRIARLEKLTMCNPPEVPKAPPENL